MKTAMVRAKTFLRDESGATVIEYGLMAGLIAVGAIAAFGVLGGGLTDLFSATSNTANNSLGDTGGVLN